MHEVLPYMGQDGTHRGGLQRLDHAVTAPKIPPSIPVQAVAKTPQTLPDCCVFA